MQKLLLAGAFVFLFNATQAQPWMQPFEGQNRVKLSDVVDRFEKQNASALKGADEGDDADFKDTKDVVKEGHNYQFDRWRWYWEQHLDADGYMVPQSKNFEEWKKLKANTYSAVNKNAKTTAGTVSNWTFQGPASSPANGRGLGRIQRVVFHPTNPNIFMVGTAGGGAWKTTTNGTSWTNMTDGFPVLGVSDLAYNPLNPNVIYMATGDRDGNDNSSLGVFRSNDGGATWNTTGFQFVRSAKKSVGSILVNPLDTASVLIATDDGIYNSRDGGITWALRQSGGFRDLLYMPNDTNVVYATTTTAIYRSRNGGFNWTNVYSIASASRVSIAVTVAQPAMVKAIYSDATTQGLVGIYTSTDTGKTFSSTFIPINCTQNYLANSVTPSASNCDGQGWYDLAIAISPLDPNKVLIGGVNTWYSTDGGVSWRLANQWSYSSNTSVDIVHADKHYITYQPLRPTNIYECNDGGIYRTVNDPSTFGWMDLTNGLGITQFYRVATANYASYAIGGAQDNGSKRMNTPTSASELTGGDGMNCEMDPLSPNNYYTSYQYGNIYRNSNVLISGNIPGRPAGGWVTPYKIHPKDPSRIVAGLDMIYLSQDYGGSWTAISGKLSSSTVSRVAFSPTDWKTIYAIWSSRVRVTFDNGTNWNTINPFVGGSPSDIIVDINRKDHFWNTFSGYGSSKVAQYDSTNGWSDISYNLPNVPVNCITQDTSNLTLYVGTDIGVFFMLPGQTAWTLYSTNLPSAAVTDMDINYGTNDIWASTYGRGLWKSPRYVDNSNVGVSIIPFATDVIAIAPNPSHGEFDIITTNASFIAQNATVNIIDMLGKTVWSGEAKFDASGRASINMSSSAVGHYIVDVMTQNGNRAKAKISIQ
ncbi:MAG: T9SS type A sorting domain-containing protein [Chitinophagaceae bacterium]